MRIQSTDEIKNLLNDLDFPASKEEIVDHAHHRSSEVADGTGTTSDDRDNTGGGGRDDAVRALSALPPGDYANLPEVLRSVPTQPVPERDESERAYQRRHHRKPGLAEHMREAELPPVKEELRRDQPER
jgi:hypothetical protein